MRKVTKNRVQTAVLVPAAVFAVGVGVAILAVGLDAVPRELGYVALLVAVAYASAAVRAAFVHNDARHRIRSIQRHLAEGALVPATVHIKEMLEECEAVAGEDDHLTLRWRHTLSQALYACGAVLDAVALAERNLRFQEEVLGPDHPETRATREHLGAMWQLEPVVTVDRWWRPE